MDNAIVVTVPIVELQIKQPHGRYRKHTVPVTRQKVLAKSFEQALVEVNEAIMDFMKQSFGEIWHC